MATGDRQVSAYREADTKQAGAKRRRWSEATKRELVAATFEPGSWVASVARLHDVNANQLFKWRRLTLAPSVELLPIEVGPAAPGAAPASTAVPEPVEGSIEIALPGGARVKITGTVDPAVVKAAVGATMKARRRR